MKGWREQNPSDRYHLTLASDSSEQEEEELDACELEGEVVLGSSL